LERLAIAPLPPGFFVNVASKGLRVFVSGLESTLTGLLTSVDSKGVARSAKEDASLKPNKLKKGIAQVYL
jgi:hypothetical protein